MPDSFDDVLWCELAPKACNCKGPYATSKGGCQGGHRSDNEGENIKGHNRKR